MEGRKPRIRYGYYLEATNELTYIPGLFLKYEELVQSLL